MLFQLSEVYTNPTSWRGINCSKCLNPSSVERMKSIYCWKNKLQRYFSGKNGQLYQHFLNFLSQINITHPSKLQRHKVLLTVKELEKRKINKEREKWKYNQEDNRERSRKTRSKKIFSNGNILSSLSLFLKGKLQENDICQY